MNIHGPKFDANPQIRFVIRLAARSFTRITENSRSILVAVDEAMT